MIERLELHNFTAFREIAIDFSPKINVIIGENGTGKTHLLKAAYALCSANKGLLERADSSEENLRNVLTQKLLRLFMPIDGMLGKMRRHTDYESAKLIAHFVFGKRISVDFRQNSKRLSIRKNGAYEQYSWDPIFIPSKEVLSLAKGMMDEGSDQRTVELIFDDGYIDLVKKMMQPSPDDSESKINLDPRLYSTVPTLARLIGGRYRWDSRGFTFQSGVYEEGNAPSHAKSESAQLHQYSTIMSFRPIKRPLFSSDMTAEGFRKIGILQRLLANGALHPGVTGPLFWDEPESNLNPKMIKQIVLALLELSRNGQQIILATHDYVLLKWFDLLMDTGKDDHVCFHFLYRDEESRDINIHTTDDYSGVSKSAISDTFAELYDEDVKRALG